MQYNNLIGESLENAERYISENNIKAVFIETKDRFNEYENKRIIRIKQLDDGESLEILYTGFPDIKENI